MDLSAPASSLEALLKLLDEGHGVWGNCLVFYSKNFCRKGGGSYSEVSMWAQMRKNTLKPICLFLNIFPER